MPIVIKKILRIAVSIGVVTFLGLGIVARKKKPTSVYANEPKERNPLEGKNVIFVENENDKENADGVRGHLEAVDYSNYQSSFYEKYVKTRNGFAHIIWRACYIKSNYGSNCVGYKNRRSRTDIIYTEKNGKK